MHIMFLLAIAGHLLCGVCDCLMTYVPGGKKFDFNVTFFIAVVTGATSLPAWACVFNTIPPFLVLTPFRIGGSGNWGGVFMFAGLMFLI